MKSNEDAALSQSDSNDQLCRAPGLLLNPCLYHSRLRSTAMDDIQTALDINQPQPSPTPDESTSVPAVPTTTTQNVTIPTWPIPMSFPAVLRVPGIGKQLTHVYDDVPGANASILRQKRSNRREDKEGKRWIRRKENGMSPT